jgi:hypothetical protein
VVPHLTRNRTWYIPPRSPRNSPQECLSRDYVSGPAIYISTSDGSACEFFETAGIRLDSVSTEDGETREFYGGRVGCVEAISFRMFTTDGGRVYHRRGESVA